MSLSLSLQAAVVYVFVLVLARIGTSAHRRAVLIAGGLSVAVLPLLSWIPTPFTEPLAPLAFLEPLAVVQEPAGEGSGLAGFAAEPPSRTLVSGWWVLWLAGLVVALGRLGWDLGAVQRLWASARDLRDDVGFSDRIDVPVVVGVTRPRILLPNAAATWSEARRQLVLAHERAHLEAHDNLWRLGMRAVACVHWFNPLAWLALRALRNACEHHADDQVLRQGVAATDYAQALIDVARARVPALSAPMARTSGLERRVRAVLGPRREGWAAGPLLGVAVVMAVACGSAVTASETRPPAHASQTTASEWSERLEREAARLSEDYAPHGIAIVVLDATSGAELGRADRGGLLERRVSPGSVIKPFVVAAALEAQVAPDHGFEDGDMRSILARSSNQGTQEIVSHVGRGPVASVFERVGLPLPAELPLARAALGDGLMVTPLAMAKAWRHLAGHGEVAPPIAETTRELLRGVVEPSGTGRQAAVEGTSIAGKTGTAPWIEADGTPVDGRYLSSFVGLVPADEPELVILVMVGAPQTDRPWGGEVAAPVFRRLAEQR